MTEHLYSLYGGYCNPIIAFPQIFTQAVAVSLVPAISAHFAKKDSGRVNDTTNLGYRTTMIMGFPCALGLFVIAEPILKLMYFRQPKSCEEAAPIMMIMAISVIFLAHMQTSVSVLQAVGKQLLPVRNLAFACIGKVVVTYLTVSIHAINVKGAAIGTMFAYIVTLLLNEYSVKKYTGLKHQISLTYVKTRRSGSRYGGRYIRSVPVGYVYSCRTRRQRGKCGRRSGGDIMRGGGIRNSSVRFQGDKNGRTGQLPGWETAREDTPKVPSEGTFKVKTSDSR